MSPAWPGFWGCLRLGAVAAVCAMSALVASCAQNPQYPQYPQYPQSTQSTQSTEDGYLIVAIDDTNETTPSPGSTPRPGYGASGYAGSTRAQALAEVLAKEFDMQEQSSWRIAPLQWRCMLYRLAPGTNKVSVMSALARDARVQLVQPLNQFKTLATSSAAAPAGTAPAPPPLAAVPMPGYDDPYVGLQRGFIAIRAASAQQWSQGAGVRVALIDSAVDGDHPDLAGRLGRQRNMVGAEQAAAAVGERHGTEMAGVIAAVANNRKGIVGVAPLAQLWAYRACWGGTQGASLCNSFTLAKALGAAIADGTDVINLSLGGPADPLLQRLVEYAITKGAIVVGALPAGSGEPGFPAGVPGVLSVSSSDDKSAGGNRPSNSASTSARYTLSAPGQDILTLAPGGGYAYASGSSLAAAHVSGAVALLRAMNPGLDAPTAHQWLTSGHSPAASSMPPIDLCQAVRQWRPAATCAASVANTH